MTEMKKLLSFVLALAMLLSAAAFVPHGTAFAEDAAALPALGDTVEGFVVKDLRDFPLVGAKIVLFEHERTGAQLVYIANSDTNRVFDLSFFTRAIDNTGLPHVFEHATLDGSEKYPSKALFFNLSYQTYNTFMNAMTGALYTTYPVASLSEAQLLKYADYYTDSCLHPMIVEDESIFREEAWRYRLADAEDELTIEGTVYSEMQGAMDLTSTAYRNLLRAAFPGSTIGNVSGGDPAFIPDMTWEALRDYHELYYHPSNCCAYLYGQFEDYTAFLKLLDEAFAPYEKREFDFTDADYTPLTESVTEQQAFPVEAGSSADNASNIFYAFVCPGLNQDPKEELVLNTLTDLLVVDASPLMQALKKALPSGQFASYIELDGPEDLIVVYGSNLNPEDAETFRSTVNEALAGIAETGFPQELVDGVMSSLSLSIKLTGESELVGQPLIDSLVSYYASTGELYGYIDYVDAMEQIDEWNEQDLYREAITNWLLGAEVTVLSTTYPEPGLREQLDEAETARLAEVKAGMSEEELQALVEQTNAEEEPDDASAYVAALQAVTVSSLPEEIRLYDVAEKEEDGVRYIDVAADVDGVGNAILLLDASALPQEDILWFALYCKLLGQLDTASYTQEELAVQMTRYLYNGQFRLSIAEDQESGALCPRLRAEWIAADEDLAAGYDLVYEMLYNSDFSDSERLSGLITKAKATLKSSINNEPYRAAIFRALGYYSPLYRYYSYFNFTDFYSFLEQTEALMAEDPAAVTAKLEAVRDFFHNRADAVAVYAGSEDGIAVNAPLSAAFMAKLDNNALEPVAYELPQPAKNEALILDSTVSYNGVAIDFASLGLEDYSGEMSAVASLVSDAYLYPMLRDQYGAYGVLHDFMEDCGPYVISYRDPNIVETFQAYEDLPAFLAGLELDQEELDGYILSTYARYAASAGELSGAAEAAMDAVTHDSQEKKLDYMRALKALTPEVLQHYAELYAAMVDEGVRFTTGGAGAINANAELYDAILNPFGSVDSTQVDFTDVTEDYEHYEAVRFAFEEMLMAPVGEDVFGVDEDASVGELAGMLYALIGGDAAAQDEAIDTFAQYGIMSGDAAADAVLTGADADAILANFSAAVGVPYAPAGLADEALTRGELAQLFLDYYNALPTE